MSDMDFWTNANLHQGQLKEAVIGGKTESPVLGQIAQVNGTLYICTAPNAAEADAKWSALGTSGDITGLTTRVGTLEGKMTTAEGKITTLEGLVGTKDDAASANGSAFAQIKTKQGTLTAGNGISIGTVSDVANTIYLPDQANVTTGEYGSATSIPKLTVSAQGIVTKTDSVTVYPPTTAGTSGQYWKSQGEGVGVWTTPATTMTAKSSEAASKAEIPSSWAVQSYVDTKVTSVYKFQGSKTVEQINEPLTGMVEGDVYNITDGGTITNTGHTPFSVAAGDNIAWTTDLGWDKMGATAVVSYPVTDVTVGGSSVLSDTVAALGAAAGLGVDTDSFTTAGDTTVPSGKLVSSKIADKMDKFGTAPSAANQVVVTAASDADTIGYLSAAVGGSKQPIYVNSSGQLTATTETLGSATKPIYLNAGTFTEGTALGDAAYLGKEEQGSASGVAITSDDSKVPTSKAVLTALGTKVDGNAAITGATKCKITYDAKGLVTAGADLSASDIPSLTAAKISDFSTEVDKMFKRVAFDTTLEAVTRVSETNKYEFTVTGYVYGVMITNASGVQCFAHTTVASNKVTVEFNTVPDDIASYTLSYVQPL